MGGFPVIAACRCLLWHPAGWGAFDGPWTGWGVIAGNDRGQDDAALVRRFREAVAKRDRGAVFDRVVRKHRDAVLGWCTERLWPDADAAVAAARDVLIVAYLAMGDPAKLARPDRLRDWLLGIAAYGGLASGPPAGVDAVHWGALEAGIGADELDAPDKPDMRGSAARRASLRRWLDQIVATLPEARQQMYDLFVRRAVDSRNAAAELGADVAEALRLRRENREAVLRAFEVSALAAAEAALDPLDGQTPWCGQLREMLADAERDGGVPGGVRRDGVRRDGLVLPPGLRLGVTRHVAECGTCRDLRDDCIAQWAPELLPILAGAELNEQVIEDLRTIPEPARSRADAPPHGRFRGASGSDGTAPVGTGRAVNTRRAALAGAGMLAVLLLLGFVQPGFLLSTASSAPRGSSSSKHPDSGSLSGGGDPRLIGSAEASRPAPSTASGSPGGLPPIAGVTATPTSSLATPTPSVRSTGQPSASPTSSSAHPTASPSPSAKPSPSPSPSATQPSPVVSTTPPSSPPPTSPTPTTTSPTPTPTPTGTPTPTT
jgi:hypothetical protein